jgi:predicted dehydrogenase
MSEPVRIGLLTTAAINKNLLETLTGDDPYEAVAVGSRDPERARSFAGTWGIPVAHGSYEELLADDRVEAVYIALPNALHYEWTMNAIAAGKHVLCEKPFSADPASVVRAFDAAEEAGVVLMEAYMWRHHELARLLAERLADLGRVLAIRSTFAFHLANRHDVRLDPELGGGALLDVGCYCISASRFISGGEPETAYGEAVIGNTGVDEQFAGILRFGEVTAEFMCGFGTEHRSLEVIGDAGALSVADPWLGSTGRLTVNGRLEEFGVVNPYRRELENFAAAVRGTAAPLLGVDDALGQSRALAALLESAKTGAPVAIRSA